MATHVGETRFDVTALNGFYDRLSSPEGMAVADFQSAYAELFGRLRETEDVDSYRLSRFDWKKLADEVSPVSIYLRFRGLDKGRVRFPLDSEAPDCWYWGDDESPKVGIEVTIALGRSRYHLKSQLVEKGISSGFLGLPNDAPPQAFEEARDRGRIMHSTAGILAATKEGVLWCLRRKDKPHFAGFTLVIQAPLGSLARERWSAIMSELQAAATLLPFTEIYVVSERDDGPWGFRIK